MSERIKAIKAQYLNSNTAVFNRTKMAAERWANSESNADNVAFHRDVGFLITCGLCESHNTPSTKEDLKLLVSNTLDVIHRNKRSVAFKLGEVLLVANRFGVMSFITQCECFKGYGSLNLVRCTPLIHELLNSRQDGYDRRDPLYNYQT